MHFTAVVVATFALCLGTNAQLNDRGSQDLRVRSALLGDEDDHNLGLEARAAEEEIDWDALATLKARSPNPSIQARELVRRLTGCDALPCDTPGQKSGCPSYCDVCGQNRKCKFPGDRGRERERGREGGRERERGRTPPREQAGTQARGRGRGRH